MGTANPDKGVEIHRIEWAQAERAFEVLDRYLRTVEIGLQPAAAVPGPGGVGIERQRLLQQSCRDPVVAEDRLRSAENRQDRRIVFTASCRGCLRQPLRLGSPAR